MDSLIFAAAVCSLLVVVVVLVAAATVDIAATSDAVVAADDVNVSKCLWQLEHGCCWCCFRASAMSLFAAAAAVVYGWARLDLMFVFALVSILPRRKRFMGIVVYGIEIAATRGIVTLGFEVVSINKFNVSFALNSLCTDESDSNDDDDDDWRAWAATALSLLSSIVYFVVIRTRCVVFPAALPSCMVLNLCAPPKTILCVLFTRCPDIMYTEKVSLDNFSCCADVALLSLFLPFTEIPSLECLEYCDNTLTALLSSPLLRWCSCVFLHVSSVHCTRHNIPPSAPSQPYREKVTVY